VDSSERQDNARTKNHENFCGQDALLTLVSVKVLTSLVRLREC
jgi:hypothetical protein